MENCRLNKGNIFPSIKSLVSDIPAGEGKTAKPFFYGAVYHQPSEKISVVDPDPQGFAVILSTGSGSRLAK